GRIGNRLPVGVDAFRPIGFDELRGCDVRSVRSIENEEVAVATRLSKQFARPPVDFTVEQNWSFHRIPIVSVVGRRLKVPGEFTGIDMESHNRFREKIVAFATLTGDNWLRISSPQIKQLEFGIVSAWNPGHSAAVSHCFRVGPSFRTGLTAFGYRRPVPLNIARFRIP